MIFIDNLVLDYHSMVNKISLADFVSMGTQAVFQRFLELD